MESAAKSSLSSYESMPTSKGSLPDSESQMFHLALLSALPYSMQQEPLTLLNIPAEIRNKIYREVLVSSRHFTVTNHPFPERCDTALLCVSKQIHAEAASIFYGESVFEFPSDLLDDTAILASLEHNFALPPIRLTTLRNFIIDIPVCMPLNSYVWLTWTPKLEIP